MGFGFRCGFLGLLHMEIVQERLEREYDLDLIITAPTVVYRCQRADGTEINVDNPCNLPDKHDNLQEPYCRCAPRAPLPPHTPSPPAGSALQLYGWVKRMAYDLDVIITAPTVVYRCQRAEGTEINVDNPCNLPDKHDNLQEPYCCAPRAPLPPHTPSPPAGSVLQLYGWVKRMAYDLDVIITAPTVVYRCQRAEGTEINVDNPCNLPDKHDNLQEPYCRCAPRAPLPPHTPSPAAGSALQLYGWVKRMAYDLDVIITAPTVVYRCQRAEGTEINVDNPCNLPDKHDNLQEPYCRCAGAENPCRAPRAQGSTLNFFCW